MKEIWIVDNDEEMGHAVGLMLKLLEYQASTFVSARSAVQSLLTGKRPSLMIVDINMAEISGLDLIEFLRRRGEWKDLPIIMLSSEASDMIMEKALKVGADAYVKKPVTIEELENAMKESFSKHPMSE